MWSITYQGEAVRFFDEDDFKAALDIESMALTGFQLESVVFIIMDTYGSVWLPSQIATLYNMYIDADRKARAMHPCL